MRWELEPKKRHSHCQALNLKQKETARSAQEDMPWLLPSSCPPFSCCWPNLTGNQLAREPKKQTAGAGPIINRRAREGQGMGLRRNRQMSCIESHLFKRETLPS